MPEAADGLRQPREPRQQRDLLRFQPGDPLIDHVEIIRDQLPLGPALFGAAERIERAAAQEFQPGEDAEGVDHPAAEFLLLEMSGRLVALREDRRGQREIPLEVGGAFFPALLWKTALGVEPPAPALA